MKKFHAFVLLVTLLASIFLSTCKKFGSRKFENGRDVAQKCYIKAMTGFMDKKTLQRTFEYNDQNNPVKVMYVGADNDEVTPTYIFTYDYTNPYYNTNSLIGYETPLSSHKFTYNIMGQIVIDSIHYYLNDSRYEEQFTYDVFSRIIKVESKNYYDVWEGYIDITNITEYEYDRKGNLIRQGVQYYDDKISIYRTHPIWQFIHRDYSVNNPVFAATYNDFELPLTYQAAGEGSGYLNFLDLSVSVESVEYFCKSDGANDPCIGCWDY